ncbi:MAG: tetratricopeptide repeat protein [Lachnospiraceae bacterium]|nr:tetratricopeptide repeat protein [Lachnospiraceae bacterium]
MSELIFCPIPMADHPYHMKSIDYDFYSLEEMVYYFRKNQVMIDSSIMDEEFVFFIKEQGEVGLADKLKQIIRAKGTVDMYMETILSYVNTISSEEKKEFLDSIKRLENKKEIEKRKVLADQMLDREKYESAIFEYNKIIELAKDKYGEEMFISSIYHNLGIAYSYLFLFDEAKAAFKESISYYDSKEARDALVFVDEATELVSKEPVAKEDNFVSMLKDSKELALRKEEISERVKRFLRSTK